MKDRAPPRPPIILAPGQVWRAEDGSTRTVLLIHPDTLYRYTSCQCLANDRRMTISQISLRAWIGKNKAVLADG